MSTQEQEQALISKLNIFCLEKLKNNRHKDHWYKTDLMLLTHLLLKEVVELQEAILREDDVTDVWCEAGDVANFAGMIASAYEFQKGEF